jgi:hypothetical protein
VMEAGVGNCSAISAVSSLRARWGTTAVSPNGQTMRLYLVRGEGQLAPMVRKKSTPRSPTTHQPANHGSQSSCPD